MESSFCKTCGSKLEITLTPNLTHYARLDCKRCNKFIEWMKNPDKKDKRTKTSKFKPEQIMKHRSYDGEPFCFFCLRTKKELGKCETITLDHIKELNEGGLDIIDNIQILCSACHKLYMNWHLKNKEENGK